MKFKNRAREVHNCPGNWLRRMVKTLPLGFASKCGLTMCPWAHYFMSLSVSCSSRRQMIVVSPEKVAVRQSNAMHV